MVSIAMNNGKFSTFSLSVDGMVGKETLTVITNVSQLMATKLEETISHGRGKVNNWITIAVSRLYYKMIRGDLSPSHLQYWAPY